MMVGRLEGKHILLGITGSIAAYKACDILRQLQKQGAEVRVVMTEAAQKFIAPLTFETLTGDEVVTTMFPDHRTLKTRHVKWAEWADCLLVCPATANLIGKVASGIADDFLSTAIMASRAPVVFAPAMDYEMIQNPIYLDNCKKLAEYGYAFVETEQGHLASGAVGPGRLGKPETIMNAVYRAVLGNTDWQGQNVLVTAGPTQEAIDPIRFLTNHSSGKMGFALAEAARLRGADVTLISGPSSLTHAPEIQRIDVESAADMAEVVKKQWPKHTILIMAAAVADFAPKAFSAQKMKKESGESVLQLQQTEDILLSIANDSHGIKVGFAMETDDGEKQAQEKLQKKKLDLICLNRPDGAETGFQADTNQITLFDKTGKQQTLPLMPKWTVAEEILNKINQLMKRD